MPGPAQGHRVWVPPPRHPFALTASLSPSQESRGTPSCLQLDRDTSGSRVTKGYPSFPSGHLGFGVPLLQQSLLDSPSHTMLLEPVGPPSCGVAWTAFPSALQSPVPSTYPVVTSGLCRNMGTPVERNPQLGGQPLPGSWSFSARRARRPQPQWKPWADEIPPHPTSAEL